MQHNARSVLFGPWVAKPTPNKMLLISIWMLWFIGFSCPGVSEVECTELSGSGLWHLLSHAETCELGQEGRNWVPQIPAFLPVASCFDLAWLLFHSSWPVEAFLSLSSPTDLRGWEGKPSSFLIRNPLRLLADLWTCWREFAHRCLAPLRLSLT